MATITKELRWYYQYYMHSLTNPNFQPWKDFSSTNNSSKRSLNNRGKRYWYIFIRGIAVYNLLYLCWFIVKTIWIEEPNQLSRLYLVAAILWLLTLLMFYPMDSIMLNPDFSRSVQRTVNVCEKMWISTTRVFHSLHCISRLNSETDGFMHGTQVYLEKVQAQRKWGKTGRERKYIKVVSKMLLSLTPAYLSIHMYVCGNNMPFEGMSVYLDNIIAAALWP
ncbi:unnamed protein product [Orchesella dallaii]|uniref:Uncharacterized protein n=1 Tax=Orchesella dallaii TaxID=48710 RepID=A0ABP1QM14_9HEXA